MLRKFMSVVALSSVPVLSFGIAQVATSGNAFAAAKSTTCSGGAQTVTFAAPGLSTQGAPRRARSQPRSTSAATSTTCTGKQARLRHRGRKQHHDHEHDEVQQGFEPAARMHGQPEVLRLRLRHSVRRRAPTRCTRPCRPRRSRTALRRTRRQHQVRPGDHVPEH